MRYKGNILESGTQLSKTATIDLVLADGNNPSAVTEEIMETNDNE